MKSTRLLRIFKVLLLSSVLSGVGTSAALADESLPHKNLNSTCEIVSRGIFENSSPKSKIDQFASEVLTAFKSKDAARFASLFHPKLQMSPTKIEKLWQGLHAHYGELKDINIYRIWRLTASGGAGADATCAEDSLTIRTHYGYAEQYAMWIQIMGSQELGRMFATVVPDKGKKLRIGFFHSQMWTAGGMDPDELLKRGAEMIQQKKVLAAYIFLDTAIKLMEGHGHLRLKAQTEIQSLLRSNGMDESFLLRVLQRLNKKAEYQLVDADSIILEKQGVGLVARFLVPRDTATPILKNQCHALIKDMLPMIKSSEDGNLLIGGFAGVQCSYVVKGEDYQKEGYLGSRIIDAQKMAALIGS